MQRKINFFDGFSRTVELPDHMVGTTGNPTLDASVEFQAYQLLAARQVAGGQFSVCGHIAAHTDPAGSVCRECVPLCMGCELAP